MLGIVVDDHDGVDGLDFDGAAADAVAGGGPRSSRSVDRVTPETTGPRRLVASAFAGRGSAFCRLHATASPD